MDEPYDERHKDSVPHDSFDKQDWNQMRMESERVENMLSEWHKDYDYVEDFAQDVFNLLSKGVPRVRGPGEMEPSHLPLRAVVQEASTMPELQQLRTYTVGDAFNSTAALISMKEVLTEALKRAKEIQEKNETPGDSGDPGGPGGQEEMEQEAHQLGSALRSELRKSLKQAVEDVDTVTGLESVFGLADGAERRVSAKERFDLAERLNNPRMRLFADMVGQFREMALGQWRTRVSDAGDEVVNVKLGDDLTRLMPVELLNLASKELEDDFWLRFADRRLLVKETKGRERVGKGPIIAVVDESGSMGGSLEMWAKAFAVALCDQARRGARDFTYIGFSGGDSLREFTFPGGVTNMDDLLEMVEGFLGGGTSFEKPLTRALEVATAAGKDLPDVVFITDGVGFVSEETVGSWAEARDKMGLRCWGIQLGPLSPVLQRLCDNVRTVDDFTPNGVKDILRDV